ncbi:ribosome small subunit-dependent GTPase A [Selenomonas caprae]|uniref:Small ribosomal subunit biogenesis GTPase RsgA n=1 Tax=Selenomonas caprae TaxID=2606905 RepID=A0A5D6WT56_9FIRM|nr:ribosome small subunit-dependent GTPase A [Selenomonas caprae]MBQ1890375.1 ribosome small subunit-dependent GTPase A [Selenomonas sp.]TYZ30435.1 ribosome small subunit-dependent GTPase A [Selenomonas caprae]
MQEGRVIKAYNSFFYVLTEAEAGQELVTCKLRGKFKKSRRSIGVVPGDRVRIDRLPDGSGVVEEQLPRTSLLKRPAVANITQVVLTFAAAQPDLHPLLLNRFLVLAEWSGIPKIVICVNKQDLYAGDIGAFLKAYEQIGYPVLRVSAQQGEGIEALRQQLQGETTVFAGPSGVGKSSLLNRIDERLSLQTGQVSEKIKRGRHTTRVAELLPYAGGFIVDTPGFSAMELTELDIQDLPGYFPEFRPHLDACRFAPCSHTHEPDCAVKAAVAAGAITQERYDAYVNIYEEIKENQKIARKKEYK